MPAYAEISGHLNGDTWLGLTVNLSGDGAPLNLSGASARMQIRKSADHPAYALEWNTAASGTISGIQFTSPASGVLTVSSGIINVPPTTYYWDLEVTLASSQIITPIGGIWTISGDVTR